MSCVNAIEFIPESLVHNTRLERTQPAITCSKLTIETQEQGVKQH